LPETRPGVQLDETGVCRGCRNADAKSRIDWDSRRAEFGRLVERVRARGADYDCVIPVSGGKDSYWQVVTCLEHGLHPLCVTYAVPGRNALGEQNLRGLIEIGVDHIDFHANPKVESAFVRRAFLERGISGLVTHMAIFAVPVRLAVAQRIPLVIYGENSAFEYGSEDASLAGAALDRRWLDSFGVTDGTTADDWVGQGLSAEDLKPYRFPSEAELDAAGTTITFLGHYFPWDPEHSLRVARQHGFKKRDGSALVGHYDFVNIDDDLIGIHHHAKWYKFGITRSWDTLSMEIRAGRLSREQALAEVRRRGDETPWDAIRAFCDRIAISERDYFEALERFRNREIWSRRGDRWVIDGFLLDDFDWPADPDVLAA
jgi:N-acetyl sugar amidotransferase